MSLTNEELNRRCAEAMGLEYEGAILKCKDDGCWIDWGDCIEWVRFTPTTNRDQCIVFVIKLWVVGIKLNKSKIDGGYYVDIASLGYAIHDPDPLRAIVIAFIKWKESDCGI